MINFIDVLIAKLFLIDYYLFNEIMMTKTLT